MKKFELCPICEKGQLKLKSFKETRAYKNVCFSLESELFECSECGAELSTPEQTNKSLIAIKNEQRKIDGLLTTDQIKSIREKLGLSLTEASEIFGGGPNSFYKYEAGIVNQSISIDNMLRATEFCPEIIQLMRFAIIKRYLLQANQPKVVVTLIEELGKRYNSAVIASAVDVYLPPQCGFTDTTNYEKPLSALMGNNAASYQIYTHTLQ